MAESDTYFAEWLSAISGAEQEMLDGYLDGFDLNTPAPSHNRSRSYLHGFKNGRADRAGKPAGLADDLRHKAAVAVAIDAGMACPLLV